MSTSITPHISDQSGKPTRYWRFSITDRETCEKAIRNGGIAALISAPFTALFAGIGFFNPPTEDDRTPLFDPWMTLDVVLIVILGIIILRKSRIAATIMVLYFVVSKTILLFDVGVRQTNLLISGIFFLFFFTAMRGTYLWHSRYKDALFPTAA